MSARASLYAAAVLWGLAFGILVYRFGVMPLVWPSKMQIVLPGLAAGMFVGGLQIARMRPRDTVAPSASSSMRARRSQPAPVLQMTGLFGVGFAATFAGLYALVPPLSHATLWRHDFSGFSLALPKGEQVASVDTYPTGTLQLKGVGDGTGAVVVSWEPGGNLTRDELRDMAPLFANVITKGRGTTKVITIVGPDRKLVDTVVFDTDDLDLELSMIACGVRHVLIATAADHGLAMLHQRIVASFRCTPDPAREATAANLAFPLKLELPGWHLVAKDDEVTQISSDDASLVLRTLPAMLRTPPDLSTFIGPAFQQAGAKVTVLEHTGDFMKVSLDDADAKGIGWLALFPCPTGTALVLGLSGDDATAMALYAKVKAATCLKSGEAPTQFPESH